MTDQPNPPQQSPSVITGPEIHPAGSHAETVRWVLPYGGNLVVRVEQDKRNPERFHAEIPRGGTYSGARADLLAAIELHARRTGEREIRRREGSLDPRDHANPPGSIPWADLWAHLYETWTAYVRLNPGHTSLPDQQLAMCRGESLAAEGKYEAAYGEFVRGWTGADAHRRYLDGAW